MFLGECLLSEQRLDEFAAVEHPQLVDTLADADVAYRHVETVADADNHTAFRRAVEFGCLLYTSDAADE